MNLAHHQKLINTSKKMLLILRILFILLILMIIIPWTLPNSSIGKFLLSLQGFPNIIQESNKNIDQFMSTLTPLSWAFGLLGSFLTLLPLILGTILMLKLFKNYINGQIFNLENARSYSNLGVIYLISAVILQQLSQIAFYLCATINNPAGKRIIAFGIDTSNLTAIFFALMLIVIGQVMKLGQKISEEQELTV